jgi:hypothetical protein
VGGAAAANVLAGMVTDGLAPQIHGHLVHFAVRVGARRLADAATALAGLGFDKAAAIATQQARLVGSLQYDLVAGRAAVAAGTLRELAPTYEELADALSTGC